MTTLIVNRNWLAAWSRVQLGTLNVVQGRLDQARELLDEALDFSLALNVPLGLIAYARLALATGDPERAALLAGPADGLRRRAGLGAWPMLRQTEAALLDQVRQALTMGRFEQVYEAGTRLSQREAVAAAREQSAGTELSWAPAGSCSSQQLAASVAVCMAADGSRGQQPATVSACAAYSCWSGRSRSGG